MKGLTRLAISIAVFFQASQPALAQRQPLDGDTLDAISAYCSEHYSENFASYDDCTFYESSHYVPTGNEYLSNYLMPLPNGDYVTYHYTLG